MKPRLAALSLCALVGLAGCRGGGSKDHDAGPPEGSAHPTAKTSATSAPSGGPGADVFTRSPLSQAELPTTDGAIALSNLNAQVAGAVGMAENNPNEPIAKERLIEELSLRGQFLGRVADFERADALAEELVKAHPKRPSARLARAGTRATFHRFKDALDDLAEAERLKARPDDIAAQKASIFAGLGRYDEALPLLHALAEARPSVSRLGSEAAVLGKMGRFDEASKLFIEAPRHFRDVAAFPIAWLYFQEASMWERAQRPERARELLSAAVSRFPAYAHAAAHLAAMEPYARGVELLTPITERSDDPEPLSVLADVLRKKGDTAAADAALAKAKARYDELIAAHPAAYADHAARFWLNLGGDPAKALSLAKKNLDVRKTDEAFDLVLTTALAAGSQADACSAAKEGAKLPYAPPLFRQAASEVATKCR